MFSRILIANRGEIACRIARTCRRLGIETVAVYSQADRGALHIDGAAASVCIGPAPAAQSYLDIPRLIAAARDTGCEAVHPGYGFLSENAAFARAVAEAGLTFIGPRAQTIEAMGDKARSKEIMRQAGVPVVPGGAEASDDPQRILEMVDEAGRPALLKPVAGGGGKGMTIVGEGDDVAAAAQATIRQARSSFGDGRLLVERYVPNPRHIEVQVFGDAHGNVVHLFERECSLQRRHQKVIEEAPAPNLPPQTREALRAAAVQGSRALSYENAGTFEFIVTSDASEVFFLEVNTRLQVEHPVTEAITGLDLVEWQLRVAAGEPLPLRQDEIRAEGHALEARIYAEDPAQDFRPAPGTLIHVAWPHGERVDTGFEAGSAVTPYYDPMIAKLVVHRAGRDGAVRALREALLATEVAGVTTNLGFLARLLETQAVRAAHADTGFIERHLDTLVDHTFAPEAAAAAALTRLGWPREDVAVASPWLVADGPGGLDRGTLSPAAPLGTVPLARGEDDVAVAVLARQGRRARVAVDGAAIDVTLTDVRPDAQLWRGRAGEARWAVVQRGNVLETQVDGWRTAFALPDRGAGLGDSAGGSAAAPLPGVVAMVTVAPGDRVARGQVLAVVEAMKMENPVTAPADGIVESVACAVGDSVGAGQVLIEIDTAQDAA